MKRSKKEEETKTANTKIGTLSPDNAGDLFVALHIYKPRELSSLNALNLNQN